MYEIEISKVIVGERFRSNVSDLGELRASIATHGLLHPIVVDAVGHLIAGLRRLKACEWLGWEAIPATVLDLDNPRAAEADENRCRLQFTPSEAVAVEEHFAAAEHEKAKARQGARTDQHPGKLPECQKGDSRDKAAAATGYSATSLRKARVVLDAAKDRPELEPVVEKMDETGRVDPAYRAVTGKAKPEKKAKATKPVREEPLVKHPRTTEYAKAAYLCLSTPLRVEFREWVLTIPDETDAAKVPRLTAEVVKDVIDTWNGIPDVPHVSVLTAPRKRLLAVRMSEEFFVQNWKAAMAKIAKIHGMRGKGVSTWRASLDWFLKDGSAVKLMEGNYDQWDGKSPKEKENDARRAKSDALLHVTTRSSQ